MKVADLQDILTLVGQLLDTAGGRKGATEVAAFREALEPFRDMTASQLTNALRKLTDPPAKPKASGKAGKLSPQDVEMLVNEVRSFYDRAGTPGTTVEAMDGIMQRLDAPAKDVLVRVADGIGLTGMKNKTKGAIAGEIRKRIEGRMGSRQRVGVVEQAQHVGAAEP